MKSCKNESDVIVKLTWEEELLRREGDPRIGALQMLLFRKIVPPPYEFKTVITFRKEVGIDFCLVSDPYEHQRVLVYAAEERIHRLRSVSGQLRAKSSAPVFVNLSEELAAIATVNAWLHESAGERIMLAHYLAKLRERSLQKERGEGPYLLCVISNTGLAIVRINPTPGWQAKIDRRQGYVSGRVFCSVREGNTKIALEWAEE